MLIKWIECKVEQDQHVAFSTAQEKWTAIADAPGFLGQIGGWDEKSRNSAFILSLWRDHASYENFMRAIHDTITKSNSQAGTYSHIVVDFFSSLMPMPGEYSGLIEAIPKGQILRVADCIVKNSHTTHFREVQQKIWIPEMQRSKGMLAGSFNISAQQETCRFLVTTLWDSLENHSAYAQNKVPVLRKLADVEGDLETIAGRLVHLVPSWQVLPN